MGHETHYVAFNNAPEKNNLTIVPRDLAHLLRKVMEPKDYAFRRWLDTPIIIWQGDWIPMEWSVDWETENYSHKTLCVFCSGQPLFLESFFTSSLAFPVFWVRKKQHGITLRTCLQGFFAWWWFDASVVHTPQRESIGPTSGGFQPFSNWQKNQQRALR